MNSNINHLQIVDELAKCIALRESAIHDPERTGRSIMLARAAHKVFPKSCHTEMGWPASAFPMFVRARSTLCSGCDISSRRAETESQRMGTLLLTRWTQSLFDGAAAMESLGFIDDDGMPPWDYWLGIVTPNSTTPTLLSWVPEPHRESVDAAVCSDAGESMSWAHIDSQSRLHALGWGNRLEDCSVSPD